MPELQPPASRTEPLLDRLMFELSLNDITYPLRMTPATSEIYNNLRRLVEELMERHVINFRGLCNQLADTEETNDLETLTAIGTSLFDGGCRTWGRVVSLIALVCCAMRTRQRSRPDQSEEIAINMASSLSTYLDQEFEPDMRRLYGGWESLGRDLPDPNLTEGKIKKWLLGSVILFGACSLTAIMTN